ncbi:MAG: hypothetical protein KDB22_01395 [Planctomycetales bacterium]|nr:hypothetical protein [Planctomycetales bacterium]
MPNSAPAMETPTPLDARIDDGDCATQETELTVMVDNAAMRAIAVRRGIGAAGADRLCCMVMWGGPYF